VSLAALRNRTAITILRTLLDAIERHGRPKVVRTDNERIFTGALFRLVLAVLGIRHQRTELHCPWMNGRIERLFGTLKGKLDRWTVESFEELTLALGDFRAWYNHARPHQHLAGCTPFEAWSGIDPYASPLVAVRYFSAWDGVLTGYWIRR
jgi:putative transposase